VSEDRFSASDLEPSDEERRASRLALVDRLAAAVGALAAGVWVGGMIALGACAAPFVFQMTPAPFSGDAMGAAFARFDQIALGAAVTLLGAEVARTYASGARARLPAARIRRVLAVLMAACAAYGGLSLSPHILELHHAGARRGVGPMGEELERTHVRAETVGKLELALGAAVVLLHVLTLATRRPEDEGDAVSPLPPGPSDG
jgi:hypothetical protein